MLLKKRIHIWEDFHIYWSSGHHTYNQPNSVVQILNTTRIVAIRS